MQLVSNLEDPFIGTVTAGVVRAFTMGSDSEGSSSSTVSNIRVYNSVSHNIVIRSAQGDWGTCFLKVLEETAIIFKYWLPITALQYLLGMVGIASES